jgi:hypothetical protein
VEYLFGLEDGGGTIGQHRSDQWDVLNILPSYLRNEVLCHMNAEIIQKVPLFRKCSDGFLRSWIYLLDQHLTVARYSSFSLHDLSQIFLPSFALNRLSLAAQDDATCNSN